MHQSTVTVLATNRNQTFLSSASTDGLIVIWKVEDSELVYYGKLHEFTCEIKDLAITRDTSHLLTAADAAGKIIVYNMHNKSVMRTLFHPKRRPVTKVLLSLYPLASIIFFSEQDNVVYVYSVNGQQLHVYNSPCKIHGMTLGSDPAFSDFLVYSV